MGRCSGEELEREWGFPCMQNLECQAYTWQGRGSMELRLVKAKEGRESMGIYAAQAGRVLGGSTYSTGYMHGVASGFYTKEFTLLDEDWITGTCSSASRCFMPFRLTGRRRERPCGGE